MQEITQQATFLSNLPPPPHYFPVSKNDFSFKTGLGKLPGDTNKSKVFIFDNLWHDYQRQKQVARSEKLNKYVIQKGLEDSLCQSVCQLIINTLIQAHATLFSLQTEKSNSVLINHINGESIRFGSDYRLLSSSEPLATPYQNLLDALCCQLQEDLSIVQINAQHDNLVYLHLCFPNHWSGESKIGKCFSGVHKTVPAMETINKKSRELNTLLMSEGPFERFTWGLSTDTRLNHHPEAPNSIDKTKCRGRDFSLNEPLYLRVERQVTLPVATENAYIFLIRTFFIELENATADELNRLKKSIQTMPEPIQQYKGIYAKKSILLQHLDRLLAKTA